MKNRHVTVRRGRHIGWWVVGRWADGGLFMLSWLPFGSWARALARLVGGRAYQESMHLKTTAPGASVRGSVAACHHDLGNLRLLALPEVSKITDLEFVAAS